MKLAQIIRTLLFSAQVPSTPIVFTRRPISLSLSIIAIWLSISKGGFVFALVYLLFDGSERLLDLFIGIENPRNLDQIWGFCMFVGEDATGVGFWVDLGFPEVGSGEFWAEQGIFLLN